MRNYSAIIFETGMPNQVHHAMTIVSMAFTFLHRIHKTLLDFVENHNTQPQKNYHKCKTVGEPAPADEGSGTKETVLESLDDGGHGVEEHNGVEIHSCHYLAFHLGEGIDDRRGVHPQLHDEGEEDLQVAVLGGPGGDEDAKAQGQAGHHEQQHGEEEGVGIQ